VITCIAIDDEPLALDLIETFCSKKENIELKKSFAKASDALTYLNKFPIDFIFLDIQMPDISGIDFYRSLHRPTLVIFTTAHSKYAVEGFNLRAVDYLLKPFKFERFEEAIEKATQMISKRNEIEDYLLIRSEYKLFKILYEDIDFIEGLDDYVKIHLTGKKPLLARMNIKGMADKLPATKFIRVHRSFIVPLNRVNFIRNKIIFIKDLEIPIGPSYEKEVMKLFALK